ncbi:MAG: MotA/TolQ/ExbB proton channel family protein [Verrucomicrobia bacterium]|nr:MAG: MotA/TolQ/ExbB proton channel family protein [Verrucomicrobiota bacterium]
MVGTDRGDSARPAVAPYHMVSCNSAKRSVFDLLVRPFASGNCPAYHYEISCMKIWVLLFGALASASPVLAQEVTATPPLVPERSQTVLETLFKAGPVMIPMVLLSIFFVMLVVVYLMTIRRGAVVSSGYMATADALLRKRDYLGLLAVSNRHGEAIARVVQKMLDFTTKNPQADLQQVREIAETEGTRVAASLNNRVIYLADIGMIAPLLGLLGTVFGIIHSFGALGADIGSARYVALSRGISEALVNTAAGLAIGIPAMVFYAFFRGRAQKLISELEAASTHVLALLSLQYGRPQRTPVLIEEEL